MPSHSKQTQGSSEIKPTTRDPLRLLIESNPCQRCRNAGNTSCTCGPGVKSGSNNGAPASTKNKQESSLLSTKSSYENPSMNSSQIQKIKDIVGPRYAPKLIEIIDSLGAGEKIEITDQNINILKIDVKNQKEIEYLQYRFSKIASSFQDEITETEKAITINLQKFRYLWKLISDYLVPVHIQNLTVRLTRQQQQSEAKLSESYKDNQLRSKL